MAYEEKIVQRAAERLRRSRERREQERWKLEQELYRRQPELEATDRALRGTMSELAELALSGRDLKPDGPEILAVREKNLALQARRTQLLRELGYESNVLDAAPACPICRDTGWTGDGMCICLKELCAREQMKELTSLLNLAEGQDFERLSLDVYSDGPWPGAARSPRENMQRIAAVCRGYARQFPAYPIENLLFSGGTGTGKTFLSGCIAREVSARGFSVVYDTAIHMFTAFEDRKFTRDAQDQRQARDAAYRYLACDLLILDDLGSELTTALTQASLYETVNSRLQAGRRTIISTNLDREEITRRYTPQISSRIAGCYRELTFYGDDIRLRPKGARSL